MLDLNNLDNASIAVLKQFCKDHEIEPQGSKSKKDSYIFAIIDWVDSQKLTK